jgi:hypothetical protein
VVRIVLDHLGGVCGGTNCLRSSWWGFKVVRIVLIILVVFLVVQIVLDHLSGVCVTSWYE